MPAPETMTTSTRRYLRECRDWLPANHPLAVALRLTAAQLDITFQTSTMAQYTKQIDQIERMAPAAGQGSLLPVSNLIGPRK